MQTQSTVRWRTLCCSTVLACSAILACSSDGKGLSIRDAQVDEPGQKIDGPMGLGGNPGTGGATVIAGGGGKPGTGGAAGLGGAGGSSGGLGKGGAAGTTATGGVPGTGGITFVGTGGVLAGGTTGNSCSDATGHIAASAKTCTRASDCRIATISTCCGSDLVVGLAQTASCAFPVPICSTDLGCPKSIYPQAEDGNTTESGGSVAVDCKQNLCTTYVTSITGAGGAGAAGGAGGSGTGGSTSTGKRDGSAGDAGTGACETDDDCIFRAEAGCCGMCLAVDDPVPPMIPCGRMCFGILNCACVDHHCTEGTLPVNSACQPNHDLCQAGSKCCIACGPQSVDGSSGCGDPACTSATYGSDGVPHCPETQ